ncbi:MAG: restriction endonuclease subunit S [Ottowia sp.]|uniref:restriction endonuclease subunit S n=1 Tax=Ottowia sp. TaxID=1898956 RepID=UPI0039E54546
MSQWPVFALRDVAEIVAGITLGRKTKDAELIEVPYMRVANVKDGLLDLSDVKTVAATAREIEKLRLRDGDLLLTEGGDLDKLGRGACWRNQLPICIHQNHIFRVRLPSDRYDMEFVSYQVGSAYGKSYFLAHAKKTTGIASINQGVLGAFPLLTPPLDEQREIAARLKAQLAEAETARAALQTQLSEVEALRAAIYREAFGRAAPEPLPITITPPPNHRKWQYLKLGDYATTTSGATPSRSNKRYWEPMEIPWVKTGEVSFTPITKTEESISGVAMRECSLPMLPPKTVLIAMYGQGKTRGQSAILEMAATINQACFAILPNDTWEPEFLHHWLIANYQNLRSLSDDRGGNQANLNGALLNALKIPAPEKTEQQRIIGRLKTHLAEAGTITQATALQLAEIEYLPQTLLAQAFGKAKAPS